MKTIKVISVLSQMLFQSNYALFREALNKSFQLMVRQAQDERNQYVTVHPELAEGFNQRVPSYQFNNWPPKSRLRSINLGNPKTVKPNE